MSSQLRRTLPLIIATVVGLFMFANYFLDLPVGISSIADYFNQWNGVLVAGGLVVGGVAFLIQYTKILKDKSESTWYVYVILATFAIQFIAGIPGFEWAWDWLNANIRDPLELAAYAMVLMFITTAAFRSFKARSIDTSLMVICAFFVFVAGAPMVKAVFPMGAAPGVWISDIIVAGVRRATTISAYLGIFYLWVRTVLWMEKRSLGVEG
jgi:hypothetical protein